MNGLKPGPVFTHKPYSDSQTEKNFGAFCEGGNYLYDLILMLNEEVQELREWVKKQEQGKG